MNWLCGKSFSFAMAILGPLMGGVLILALTVHGMQTRFALFEDRLKFTLEKLDPIRNLQTMFSTRQALVPLIILCKVLAVLIVAYLTLNPLVGQWLKNLPYDTVLFVRKTWETAVLLIFRTALLMLVIGVIDYGVHWWMHEKQLKMTREEIKEEFKQEEGSPQIKQRIRQRFQQLSRSRMMKKVPESSVVITNPTTLAIALKYQRDKMAAPQVMAKGKGIIAERIKSIAREHKIPIVPDKPLTRAMYPVVELGQMVPPQFFHAVATILAYVYRLRNRKSSNRR